MKAAFLAFFVFYLLYALWENARHKADEPHRLSLFSAMLQGPLFVLGIWFVVDAGGLNRNLVFLPAVFAALLLGHLMFVLSLLFTDGQAREAWRQLVHVRPVYEFLVNDPNALFRVLGVAIAEEVIYRGAAQPLLIALTGSTWLGLLLAAAAFCVVHGHFFRNPVRQSVEFSVFSVLLGALYFWSENLSVVSLVHAVRNWEIAYLEHALAEQEKEETLPAGAGRPGVQRLEYDEQ